MISNVLSKIRQNPKDFWSTTGLIMLCVFLLAGLAYAVRCDFIQKDKQRSALFTEADNAIAHINNETADQVDDLCDRLIALNANGHLNDHTDASEKAAILSNAWIEAQYQKDSQDPMLAILLNSKNTYEYDSDRFCYFSNQRPRATAHYLADLAAHKDRETVWKQFSQDPKNKVFTVSLVKDQDNNQTFVGINITVTHNVLGHIVQENRGTWEYGFGEIEDLMKVTSMTTLEKKQLQLVVMK